MKKAVKIISVITVIIIIAPLVLSNIWSLVISVMFHMPSEMKEESVCFLAPGLTWNSTISEVNECFGEPTEKEHYNEETGQGTTAYSAMYEKRPMRVYATRRVFWVTDMFHKRRVHRYGFNIECYDEDDEKAVFERLCKELTDSKAADEGFTCSNDSENEFSAVINYGATKVYYVISYDIYDDSNIVYFYADAMY